MLTIIWRQTPKLCITVYCNTEFTVIQSYSFHSKAQQRLKEIYLVKQQPQKSHNKINGWIGIWNLEMSFFEERGEPEYPEKNLGAKERTNKKLNPHMALMPGFERGPQWWEASALTTAPSLASQGTQTITKHKQEILQKHLQINWLNFASHRMHAMNYFASLVLFIHQGPIKLPLAHGVILMVQSSKNHLDL